MRFAKHLTVRNIRGAALTPCGNMVCIHLTYLVDTMLIIVMTKSAKRAVRLILFIGSIRLFLVNGTLSFLVKYPYRQQRSINFTAEHILKDTALVTYLQGGTAKYRTRPSRIKIC